MSGFGKDIGGFEPWFKLDLGGKVRMVYVIRLDRELYSEYGDFESDLIRVYRDGTLLFNEFDSYIASDDVEGFDINGVELYRECVRLDDIFDDYTEEARSRGEI